MVKSRHLYWVERVASLAMSFAFGFLFGTAYPKTPIIYLLAVVFIGACTKIWLYHKLQKLQKSEPLK